MTWHLRRKGDAMRKKQQKMFQLPFALMSIEYLAFSVLYLLYLKGQITLAVFLPIVFAVISFGYVICCIALLKNMLKKRK
jgi:hypothetical protein